MHNFRINETTKIGFPELEILVMPTQTSEGIIRSVMELRLGGVFLNRSILEFEGIKAFNDHNHEQVALLCRMLAKTINYSKAVIVNEGRFYIELDKATGKWMVPTKDGDIIELEPGYRP